MTKQFQPSDVTLYVPCYNAGMTIGECLEGIAAQTAKPAVLLLIDDGSTPRLDVADKLNDLKNLNKLNNIKKIDVIRHPVNTGLASARNTALRACTTPLIAALDSDVHPEPPWLERLLEVFNTEPAEPDNIAGAGGLMLEHFHDTLADRWRGIHMAQHWGHVPHRNPRFLYGANTLLRADALRQAGGYNEKLRTNNEDSDISEKLYERGAVLYYTPAARCRHMRRDTVNTILPGYWRWHHAAGVLRGDFDRPTGLISRIEAVNFGIFRYRFDMDEKAGRREFLGLDAALPWVFCARDILFYGQCTGQAVPLFPPMELIGQLPEFLRTVLTRLLPDNKAEGLVDRHRNPPWFAEYMTVFKQCLENEGWWQLCMDPAIWAFLCSKNI